MVLGARWVIDRADERLGMAARNALAKIGAVVPPPLKSELETGTLLVPTQSRPTFDGKFVESIRRAIRQETKVTIKYRDLADQLTQRVIWPFALAFFDQVLIVIAWCEMRRDFRHFRADGVESWHDSKTSYARRRLELLREWQEKQGIPLHKYDL